MENRGFESWPPWFRREFNENLAAFSAAIDALEREHHNALVADFARELEQLPTAPEPSSDEPGA